jgi:tyrosyl-tRNA synthetase
VRAGVLHPKKAKMELAHNIVAGFHGEEAARKAGEEFERVFGARRAPEEMQEIRLTRTPTRDSLVSDLPGPKVVSRSQTKWAQILAYLGEVESISEAARVIKQGGLEINGRIVKDPTVRLDPDVAAKYELRLGKKRFLRIVVE